ncbi:MAG: glutathione S-transferase family protein, partial [Okeania sp. SIO2H7]|nr:glutathione S-transferase family protein [Okeania sp. SIO2H7]
GLSSVPVLLPQIEGQPEAIADSTEILKYLESFNPAPELFLSDSHLQREAQLLEDWLDESIGTATRFVYYHFRAKEGKGIDPSFSSQAIIRVVRWQYGINEAAVRLASDRLANALEILSHRWQASPYLVGDRPSIADLTAAGLLSPLALIPQYRKDHPWLFQRIGEIHQLCNEPPPPGN